MAGCLRARFALKVGRIHQNNKSVSLMQRMCRAALVALGVCLLSGVAQARTLDQVPVYIKKEGGFVTYPAQAVGYLGLAVGAVVATPFAIVAAPFGFASGDPVRYTLLPVSVLATGGAEAGYHVGGALPWVLKNAFYDAPMSGIARLKGWPPSGLVADLGPPPPDPTETQYLASTPPDARVLLPDVPRVSAALPPPREATSLILLKRRISPFKPPPESAQRAAKAQVSLPQPLPVPRPATAARAKPAAELPVPPKAAVVDAESDIGDAERAASERPRLKAKKRRFSERFRF